MPRGRPKKNQTSTGTLNVIDGVGTITFTDGNGTYAPIDETKHEHTLRQMEVDKQAANLTKEVEHWFVISNGKVLKKTKKANGNVSSNFVCLELKETKDYIDNLKKHNEFRMN